MTEFLKMQYRLGHITAEELGGFAPRWLTEAEVAAILEEVEG